MSLKTSLEYPKVKFKIKEGIVDTWEEVIFVYNNMLDTILKTITVEITSWIMKYVPAKTQALRASLIESLQTSSIINNTLQLKFGSSLIYAGIVDAMPTNRVRHMGEWDRGYFLDDPNAIGGYMGELEAFAYDRLMFLLQTNIDTYFKGYGSIMRSIRGGTGIGR